jgi:hypothetical protein
MLSEVFQLLFAQGHDALLQKRWVFSVQKEQNGQGVCVWDVIFISMGQVLEYMLA